MSDVFVFIVMNIFKNWMRLLKFSSFLQFAVPS